MMPIGHMTLRGAPVRFLPDHLSAELLTQTTVEQRATTYLRTYATSATGGPVKDNTMLYWGGGAAALLGLWWVYAKPVSSNLPLL